MIKKIFYAAVVIIVLLTACKQEKKVSEVKLEGFVFGTTYHITNLNGVDYQKSIDSLFYLVNKSLSTYLPTSDISKINRNESATIDKHFENKSTKEEISYSDAVKIGFFQCIAMIPGVSRSASSIIGGMFQGLSRKSSAEFSFFLTVPTLFAASAYKLLKGYLAGELSFSTEELQLLAVGNIVAFVVAMAAIKLANSVYCAVFSTSALAARSLTFG